MAQIEQNIRDLAATLLMIHYQPSPVSSNVVTLFPKLIVVFMAYYKVYIVYWLKSQLIIYVLVLIMVVCNTCQGKSLVVAG